MSAAEESCLSATHFFSLFSCDINTTAVGSAVDSSQNQETMLTSCVMCRHPDRGQVAGILEVIQTSEDMVFSDLVEILSQVLARPLLGTAMLFGAS